MGHTGALGFAELVEAEELPLEAALQWHLGSNHFPPIPLVFVPVAVTAIGMAKDEEWEANVKLPNGITTNDGRSAISVWEVVETLHLEAFL